MGAATTAYGDRPPPPPPPPPPLTRLRRMASLTALRSELQRMVEECLRQGIIRHDHMAAACTTSDG